MLFNSLEFALFLPIGFLLYWFVFNKHLRLQNLFIVVVSYIFYGWWDWRFLLLIAFTTFCSWLSGVLIRHEGGYGSLVQYRVGDGLSTGSSSLTHFKSTRLFRFYYQYPIWVEHDFDDAV